jgi:hypothetical protein
VSPFQRGCAALVRANQLERVEALFASALAAERLNDALFIASLIKDDQVQFHQVGSPRVIHELNDSAAGVWLLETRPGAEGQT